MSIVHSHDPGEGAGGGQQTLAEVQLYRPSSHPGSGYTLDEG